ncbi:MAG: 4Fe-4S dicluster domain-containing protein, partial [Muribaculaceae bacterium]|nr:4Fe-4S dicluster domain-containing protein [Muribaculaceae bacterium]
GSTTKGMSGLLLLNSQEAPLRDTTPCVRCGRCVEVCPMGLEPYLLAKLSQLGRIDDAAARHVADCMECGCCSYSCMAGRPLVDWIKVGKSMARQR